RSPHEEERLLSDPLLQLLVDPIEDLAHAWQTSAAMPVYAALLRGINVGGKNKVPMLELAAIFGEIGCTDVVTYIQSGNVVFRAPASLAASLPKTAARRIAEEFGCKVPVILRTAAELRAAHAENPFVARGLDPNALHIMFLADRPTARAVA